MRVLDGRPLNTARDGLAEAQHRAALDQFHADLQRERAKATAEMINAGG